VHPKRGNSADSAATAAAQPRPAPNLYRGSLRLSILGQNRRLNPVIVSRETSLPYTEG
jgi:hypothetical protein